MSGDAHSRVVRLERFFLEMSRIRGFEEAVAEGYRDGALPGLLHLSMGSEATTVGVIGLLQDMDRIYSTHRPHGHFLAAGSDPRAIMAELAGRATGLCQGRAGSMHLMDERAIMATGIVGGTLSLAVGHALWAPPGAVVVAFFGDGAVQTGTFHESLNMASLWRVPVLFVCENNGWIEFSSRSEHTRVEHVTRYGDLYEMTALAVDGCDVEAVATAAGEMLDALRDGQGPALLECHTRRLRPHYEGDLRTGDGGIDPLDRCAELLVEFGKDRAALEERRLGDIDQARALLAAVLADPPATALSEEPSVFAVPR